MSTTQMDTLLMERFLALQSPIGRWRLNGYARLKRLVWRCLTGGTRRAKRVFDAGVTFLLLLLLSPLFLLIALLIKLEDGGPVFFVQTRVGKWGRHFKMFKFCSMYVNAEQRGDHRRSDMQRHVLTVLLHGVEYARLYAAH